jgi:ferrochelatase
MVSDPDNAAVLLMAYGTPSTEDEIEPYLTGIRRGRKPTLNEIEDLKRRYREIGGHSPLREIAKEQASALERQLRAKEVEVSVYCGMKHWHPYISETVRDILRLGVHKIVGLVLAPHYSRMSVGGYRDALQNALRNSETVEADFVESWYNNAIFHSAIAEKMIDAFNKFPPDTDISVLFTAHSLPERIIAEGDPYPTQLLQSCKAVAKLVSREQWLFAYQSAGQTGEKWLGPDILELLGKMATKSSVLVVPIGFVADHLEILYDIDVEAMAFAKSRGITLRRIDSLNTSPKFISALTDIVCDRLTSQ